MELRLTFGIRLHALTNGTLILPDRLIEDGEIVVTDGVIESCWPSPKTDSLVGRIVDLKGAYLSPGFVDLHVHGGGGADFMDGTADAVQVANRLSCGSRHDHDLPDHDNRVTRSDSRPMIAACGEVYRPGARRKWGTYTAASICTARTSPPTRSGATPEKAAAIRTRRGPAHFSTGLVRIATCAAELPGAVEFYKLARKHGCLVTCGHSNSCWGEMEAAFKAGMRHVEPFLVRDESVVSLRSRFGTPMQASMEQFVLATPR